MSNLEALIILRGCARASAQMRTPRGVTAGKVVDRKIQSLMRKRAWRESSGGIPVHMGDDDFKYRIPDDPMTSALRALVAACREKTAAMPTAEQNEALSVALKNAEDLLASIPTA